MDPNNPSLRRIEIDTDTFIMPDLQPSSPDDGVERALFGEVVIQRETMPSVHPGTEEKFWPYAFPNLFPYGEGYPPPSKDISVRAIAKHFIKLGGDRAFQASSSWIFATYYSHMSKAVSNIASLVTARNVGGPSKGLDIASESNASYFSAANVISLLDQQNSSSSSPVHDFASAAKISEIKKKLMTFGEMIPGTAMHVAQLRKKVLAMIDSPLVNEKVQNFVCVFC
jgi:hypothetical protein